MTIQFQQITALKDQDSLSRILSRVLLTESDAVRSVIDKTESSLAAAVLAIFQSKGQLIVSGVGKSGHIAQKIASTFRSLGKSAAFLHAAEASHGDLGILHDDSVVLILSNSGESAELSDLLAYCRTYDMPVISITASKTSTLGKASQIAIAHGSLTEACINGLAPTTSTTVALALGDALAVGVSHLSDARPQDFRRYHPGGKLGARQLKSGDLMHRSTALPIVRPSTPMQEVVIEMSSKGFGTAIVCEGSKPVGTITDRDMRRNADRLWQCCAADLISEPPTAIPPGLLAGEALRIMRDRDVTSLIVSSVYGDLMGLIRLNDCLRAGVDK